MPPLPLPLLLLLAATLRPPAASLRSSASALPPVGYRRQEMRRAVANLIHRSRTEPVAGRIAIHHPHQGVAPALLTSSMRPPPVRPPTASPSLRQNARALGQIGIHLAEVVIQHKTIAACTRATTCLNGRPRTRTAATATARLSPGPRGGDCGNRPRPHRTVRGRCYLRVGCTRRGHCGAYIGVGTSLLMLLPLPLPPLRSPGHLSI